MVDGNLILDSDQKELWVFEWITSLSHILDFSDSLLIIFWNLDPEQLNWHWQHTTAELKRAFKKNHSIKMALLKNPKDMNMNRSHEITIMIALDKSKPFN